MHVSVGIYVDLLHAFSGCNSADGSGLAFHVLFKFNLIQFVKDGYMHAWN